MLPTSIRSSTFICNRSKFENLLIVSLLQKTYLQHRNRTKTSLPKLHVALLLFHDVLNTTDDNDSKINHSNLQNSENCGIRIVVIIVMLPRYFHHSESCRNYRHKDWKEKQILQYSEEKHKNNIPFWIDFCHNGYTDDQVRIIRAVTQLGQEQCDCINVGCCKLCYTLIVREFFPPLLEVKVKELLKLLKCEK